MSIIHDALKKVQQSGPAQPAPVAAPDPAVREAVVKKPLNIPLLGGIMCVLMIVIATLLQPAAKPPAATPVAATPAPAAVVNAPAAVVQPAPQQAVAPADPLSTIQIEGVMDMDGKKVVLISGNVYEEGQTIKGGGVITKITFDTLTVTQDGQERSFPVKP
jgi:hypothetical protein